MERFTYFIILVGALIIAVYFGSATLANWYLTNAPDPSATTTVVSEPSEMDNLVDEAVLTVFFPEVGDPYTATVRFMDMNIGVFIAPAVAESSLGGTVLEALEVVSGLTGANFYPVDEANARMAIIALPGTAPANMKGNAKLRFEATTFAIEDVVVLLRLDMEPEYAQGIVYEEIIQAMGPAGDWGPEGSLMSSIPTTSTFPSRFDVRVLSVLYSIPAGSSPVEFQAAW